MAGEGKESAFYVQNRAMKEVDVKSREQSPDI
jgi:hypothetical protein